MSMHLNYVLCVDPTRDYWHSSCEPLVQPGSRPPSRLLLHPHHQHHEEPNMSVRRRQVGLHFRYTVAFLSDVTINLSYVRTVYTVCTVQDLCNHVSQQLNPTHSILTPNYTTLAPIFTPILYAFFRLGIPKTSTKKRKKMMMRHQLLLPLNWKTFSFQKNILRPGILDLLGQEVRGNDQVKKHQT